MLKKKEEHQSTEDEILAFEEKREAVNNKAKEYLHDKEKLKNLIEEAEVKAKDEKSNKGIVKEMWDSLKEMFELVKAYINGDYRRIPYGSLLMIVGAILYFVMPVDTIPDFLAVLGLTDDAAVIAFTIKKVKKDLDQFIEWKQQQEINLEDETE